MNDDNFDPDDHLWTCDWVRARRRGEPDGECYCPTEGEQRTRACGHLVDIECGCDEW